MREFAEHASGMVMLIVNFLHYYIVAVALGRADRVDFPLNL